MKKKTEKFNENISKRGQVTKAKEEKLGVGPIVLGILVFIVVGSGVYWKTTTDPLSGDANISRLLIQYSIKILFHSTRIWLQKIL